MHSITRTFFSFATMAVALCVATPGLAAKPLEDAKWIEVTTPNFQIVSVLGKKKTTQMIRHLELVRRAFLHSTNVNQTDAPVPTRIYAADNNDFEFLGLSGSLGLFQSGIRDNTILARNTRWADESAIIMHEYAHLLLRNNSEIDYPRWYDEGFAEYFAASKIQDGLFLIGLAPDSWIFGLENRRWISSHQLLDSAVFSTLDRNERVMFYAQAWLLVHYLQNANHGAAQFLSDMKRYTAMTASGRGEIESFEQVFQIEAWRLSSTLYAYLSRDCCRTFGLRIDQVLPELSVNTRQLPRAEAALRLGQLALKRDKTEAALHWFEIAIANDETRARALSDSAAILLNRQAFDEAEQRLKDGIALAPDDPYTHLNLAQYWIARAEILDDPDSRARFIDKAKQAILSAWKIDNTIPEIYVLNGQAYLVSQQDAEKAVEMLEEAARLLPSIESIRLMLARAYIDAGRSNDAIAQAQLVIAWSHDEDSETQQAHEIIKLINHDGDGSRPVDRSAESLPQK